MPRYRRGLVLTLLTVAGVATAAEPQKQLAPPVAWSTLVSTATLQSEINAQADALDAGANLPLRQTQVRVVFSYLAALYGVVDRYDQPIAWRAEAHAARDAYSRSAQLTKGWFDSRRDQIDKQLAALSEHVRAKKPQLSESLPADAPWEKIVDRRPLMHRLEIAERERLVLWTRDADGVKKHADAVIREAEIVAMLGRIIQDESYEFGDDATYRDFARELEKHATECAQAVKRGEPSAAIRAYVGLAKACADCHEGYRSVNR